MPGLGEVTPCLGLTSDGQRKGRMCSQRPSKLWEAVQLAAVLCLGEAPCSGTCVTRPVARPVAPGAPHVCFAQGPRGSTICG